MENHHLHDFENKFPDNESCLQWLMDKVYPDGVECKICNKITRHHKVSKRSCYACDFCGNHVYPTAGTLFYKSQVPLRTWFQVVNKISTSDNTISAKEIQKAYDLSYNTARQMRKKIIQFLNNKQNNLLEGIKEAYSLKNPILNKLEKSYKNSPRPTKIIRRAHETNPDRYYWKRDRTARLLKVEMLLIQKPDGLSVKELISKCGVSKRTIYRDLIALENELGIPIWENKNKRGIVEGYCLPPISFTPLEAMRVFLSLRLMLNYSHIYDQTTAGTFMKLNTVIPWPLRQQNQSCLEYLEKLPRNEKTINNLDSLASAWMSRRRVRFRFQEITDNKPTERIFDIYFIEPGVWGHSTYLIGYCHLKNTIYTYKTDRIIGDVIQEKESYDIPPDFNALDYLESVWTIQNERETMITKLLFNSKIKEAVKNTVWHPSQELQCQSDGSVIMTLKVRNTLDFRSWILGWGPDVEVLEPENLRKSVILACKELQNIYLPE
jgi:predicted DNA-binding transcriptional regulator YafY